MTDVAEVVRRKPGYFPEHDCSAPSYRLSQAAGTLKYMEYKKQEYGGENNAVSFSTEDSILQ